MQEMHSNIHSLGNCDGLGKIIRVCFFGASVTAQGEARNGDKNGYVSHLQDLLSHLGHVKIEKHAFGSNQFYAIGKYALASILHSMPDIIFFEWHTTSEESHSIHQWVCSLQLAKKCGSEPVVLVLPRRNSDPAAPKYRILKDLTDYASVLDLRHLGDEQSDVIFRDTVHTTSRGGYLYATKIGGFLESTILPKMLSRESYIMQTPWLVPEFYSKLGQIAYDRIKVDLAIDSSKYLLIRNPTPENAEYGFWGLKGPTCGNAIVYRTPGSCPDVIRCVDQWCYYTRESLLFRLTIPAFCFVKIGVNGDIEEFSKHCPKALEEPYSVSLPTENKFFTLNITDIYYSIGALPLVAIHDS
jgi:hypothetical protein